MQSYLILLDEKKENHENIFLQDWKKKWFLLPIAVNETEIKYVKKYARCGSSDFPFPTEKYFKPGNIISRQTAWNIFGAPTRLAKKTTNETNFREYLFSPKALDNVAANIPANIKT